MRGLSSNNAKKRPKINKELIFLVISRKFLSFVEKRYFQRKSLAEEESLLVCPSFRNRPVRFRSRTGLSIFYQSVLHQGQTRLTFRPRSQLSGPCHLFMTLYSSQLVNRYPSRVAWIFTGHANKLSCALKNFSLSRYVRTSLCRSAFVCRIFSGPDLTYRL